MGQDSDRIEKTYDRVAKAYSEAFFEEHEKKPMDRDMLHRFAAEIGNRKPVWDLGCGPGQTTRYLHERGLDIMGLDLSGNLLSEAKALHPGIHFQKGDLLDLDFADQTVAGVVCFYAIVHFSKEQVETALGETFRVLQPGGLLLLTFHAGQEILHLDAFLGHSIDIDFMLFPTEFIRTALEGCGFEGIEILEREPYPDVEHQSRRAYAFARKPERSL